MPHTTERLGASLEPLLDRIAAKAPTPGGGAVAAWIGATGASLGLMVIAYSLGRRQEHEASLQHDRSTLETARALFTELAEEDAAAYEALAGVLKLKKDDPSRAERLPAAVGRAIEVPSAIAATALNVLRAFEEMAARANPYLLSDLGVATATIGSAVEGAGWMVKANFPLVKDEQKAAALRAEVESWQERSAGLQRRIERSIEGS